MMVLQVESVRVSGGGSAVSVELKYQIYEGWRDDYNKI